MNNTQTATCQVPPTGWECSRAADHEGPCAASPVSAEAGHPGLELKALIKRGGFTQDAVATQIGILPSQFSEILSGKRPFSAMLCVRLAVCLGVNAEEWYRKQADWEVAQARLALIKAVLPQG